MGCYMSTPDDKVYITEGKGKDFHYATASCQGWRREQEDAEDCLPFFDEDASLFILCDGHGGSEVAKYTVQHFPEFLKKQQLYKDGKYEKALERAFIEFDALLRTEEVSKELHRIAFDDDPCNKPENKNNESQVDSAATADEPSTGNSSSNDQACGSSAASSSNLAGPSSSNGPSSVVEDDDAETLRREAQVPIHELIDKYSGKPSIKGRANSIRQASLNLAGSPVIRSRKDDDEDDDDDSDAEVKPKTGQGEAFDASTSDPEKPSSSKQTDDDPSSSTKTSDITNLKDILTKAIEQYFDKDDDNSEDDSEFEGDDDTSGSEDDDDDDDDEDEDEDENDDDDEGDDDEVDDEDNEDGDDEGDDDNGEKSRSKRLKHKRSSSQAVNTSDDSSSEVESSDLDEEEEEGEDEEEVSGSERNVEYEVEEDDGLGITCLRKINQNLKAAQRIHKPGMDSGCTVVVALVKNNKLYVASAGDSRCIVIRRDGQYKPMSFDHKPENRGELRRIQMAGGRVAEGRVNGGLNLSRAFGDFTYKATYIPAENQMITPRPDVRTTEIDPNEVEYIFLACDGIWNSMRNQQVAKFIKKVSPTVNGDLTEICLKLFRNCIAPGTDGDGTGCDNMTCIIVRYGTSANEENNEKIATNQIDLKTNDNASSSNNQDASQATKTSENNNDPHNEPQSSTTVDHYSNKRSADDESEEINVNRGACKRRCIRLPPVK